MIPERWQEVKAIVAQALETPEAERAAYLSDACADDDALRTEVDSLLAHAHGSDSLPHVRAAIADASEHAVLHAALGAQYEILRVLGRGGMGTVYLARERALERFVAIKVLRPDLPNAIESRERFRREARIAAQLSHPGILPLHTFGEAAGLWYFVMGYVRGASLADRLRMDGSLPIEEAQRILWELADALQCAHDHGVVHRDIKPANVLLDETTGRAMLADFGISKMRGAGEHVTATGAIIGTPHFMSPEQSVGSADVDERSDIYSLGAVGYMMLAGREPFADVPPGQVMHQRVSHDPAPLTTLAPRVPIALARVIERSMMRDPASRWPTARSMKEAVDRTRTDEPTPLPESLRDLPTFGPYALLWAAGWTALAFRQFSAHGDRAMLLLVALVVPIGFALHIGNADRQGLHVRELARIAFWPPEWWGMWWPRTLRRPGDVWQRLPWPARAVRRILSLLFVLLPLMVLLRQRLSGGIGEAAREAQALWFTAAEALSLGTAAIAVVAALAWARSRGLSLTATTRLLFGATATSSAWKVPGVARLLRTRDGAVRAPARDSADDHLRAIAEVLSTWTNGEATLRASVLAAARRLRAAIDEYDRELAFVAAVAGTPELDRLAARESALTASGREPNQEQQEMLELVHRQLDLARRMGAHGEILMHERGKALAHMRALFAQLSIEGDDRVRRVGRLLEEMASR